MAARAPDPHNLRNSSRAVAAATATINTDRECAGCGYNLRGLPTNVRCPECGMSALAMGESDDALSLAPLRVILACIRGCWAAAIIIALAVGLVIARRFAGWPGEISDFGLAGLALLWVGAVAWLTPAFGIPQAASRGFTRRGKLRRVTRWLQWGWPALAAAQLLHDYGNPTGRALALLNAAAVFAALAGIAGIVLLAIMLERLSEWARDDRAQTLFNWASWGIPTSTVLMLINVPIPMAGLLFFALWLASIGLFPYALLTLASSVTLSAVHSYEHRERESRRAERRREDSDKRVRAVKTMDAERARRGHV